MASRPSPVGGLYDPFYEHDACGVGFLVHLKGHRSHAILQSALRALGCLDHRGARGCEVNTGDGAGVLIQVPDGFLRQAMAGAIVLPEPGAYGTGCLFLPRDGRQAAAARRLFEDLCAEEGQRFLGWRDVPTNHAGLGATALAGEPTVVQAFVGAGRGIDDPDRFERKLYVIRKVFENRVLASDLPDAATIYFPSLSCYTLVYKGMLTTQQLFTYYPDLHDPAVETALCMYHSRFSTNTFPSWKLAHPYRMLAHNGEINTLRGNINWQRAREMAMDSPNFEPGDVRKLLPIIREGQSDTATLDNMLELLIKAGRNVAEAMMMLIPEAWENHAFMPREKRDFYAYHGCLMEPWDGPASVAVTDGKTIGATLDRNGLRPSRYWVTADDLVIMASEVGVLDIPPEKVVIKGRLEPGRMFFVDMNEGRIVADDELKHSIATARPYGLWLAEQQARLDQLPAVPATPPPAPATLLQRQLAFGYTLEDQKYILGPMAADGLWAIGSMGCDTPLAVLSDRPQVLYNYFKQLFAQVTNPPLDCIREELVTAVWTVLGAQDNLLDPGPEAAHMLALDSPVLTVDELARVQALDGWRGFRAVTLPMLFRVADGAAGLRAALDALFAAADAAIAGGANLIVLSDRGHDAERAPIPALLATAGLHHHLVRNQTRTRVGLIVEAGDVREVHHFCLLFGYGAGAVCPYLAFETIDALAAAGDLPAVSAEKARANYLKAVLKGVVKVMARMGISTLQSYRGAQIFEAVGLGKAFCDEYFTHTASRVGGIGLEEVCAEVCAHHRRAYPRRQVGPRLLDWGGQYQWRRDGEHHLFNPETVFRLQHAVRTGSLETFRQYSRLVDDQSQRMATLRGLMELRLDPAAAVPLEEVEPVEAIVQRFCTGAMSYGSISQEAHETLAIAMNRLGGWSNTGEGGEDPARFAVLPNGDSKRSRIKQVASGRFGVTSEYLVSADELQIKMAQGAKPGEGGELPGHKVYPWIAAVRHTTPYVGLISPPPHHDIYSIEDLAQLIFDLKNSNPHARISVKLVSEIGVGTIAAGVAKAHSDVVLISGHDGGTGASPITSIKHAGLPWELGVAETQQTLVANGLRDRIVVQADGQLKTGRDVIIAALLGAEEFGFATSALVALGCIMMRVCHLDTCPVGVATQNPALRAKFTGQPEHVENFMRFVAEEMRELMAQLGFRTVAEMVGRSDKLDLRPAIDHYKARGLDFTAIFWRPEVPAGTAVHRVREQDHGLAEVLDRELVRRCAPALEQGEPVRLELPIQNTDRTTGTILGSHLTRRWGGAGLPPDTIQIRFTGSAGQSFGAFVPRGITLRLEGDSNDYCGKGLSGGKIVVFPPRAAPFRAEEQILIGNVALYGATSGKAFFRGRAGERFCVRNSGVHAVVEGLGDHGCEYMTGGVAVILGPTGRNFAAGMSGGMAFVLDEQRRFEQLCNREMVDLEPFEAPADLELVQALLREHAAETGSPVAERVLTEWDRLRGAFWKVMPVDYKRALAEAAARSAAEEPVAAD